MHILVTSVNVSQLETQFPLKGVLGVKGVLGPRARVKGYKLKLFFRARADPGPHSPRGPLSREILFGVSAQHGCTPRLHDPWRASRRSSLMTLYGER